MPDLHSSSEFLFIKVASMWSETSSNHTVVSNPAADDGAVWLAYQF